MLDTIFKPHLQSQRALIKCAGLDVKYLNELLETKSPLKVWFLTRKFKPLAQGVEWRLPD
jgi:hypothetical protein